MKLRWVGVLVALLILMPVQVSALGEEETSLYQSFWQESGAQELADRLPAEGQEILREAGLSDDPTALLGISPLQVGKAVFGGMKNRIQIPMQVLLRCVGVLLLCALLDALKPNGTITGKEGLFSGIAALCMSAAVIEPILQVITGTARLLREISDFLLSFVPVYVGVVTAAGKPLSATAGPGTLSLLAQGISRLGANVLLPVTGMFLAFSLIGGVSDRLRISGLAGTVRQGAVYGLTFLLTLFVGVLNVQGFVTGAADAVSLKATRFAVSSFVPVVGSALSDAMGTVQGCMSLCRAAVGSFSILALLAVLLPPLGELLLLRLSLSLARGVGGLLGLSGMEELLKGAGETVALLLGLVFLFGVLIVVSLALLISLTGGAG